MTHSAGTIAAGVLLPPLGVHLAGAPVRDFWIAVALTVLGFIPGVIWALVVLARAERPVALT